jgi:hypothetical protein
MAESKTQQDEKAGTRLLKELRTRLMMPDLTQQAIDWSKVPDPQLKPIIDAAQAAIDCIAAKDADGAVANTFAAFQGLMMIQATSLTEIRNRTTYTRFQWLKKKCVDAMLGGKPIRGEGDNPKGTRFDPAVKAKAVEECKRLIEGGMKKTAARLKMKNKYHIPPKTLYRAGA